MKSFGKWAVTALFLPALAEAKILPDNDLHKQDRLNSLNGISQVSFDSIVNHAVQKYEPIFAGFGVRLRMNANWESTTVNASAYQLGSDWWIDMYGGLARRPEITDDGFALVICHEIGHHLGGFPFYTGHTMSTEGQSDYYATHTCAPILWGDQYDENRRFADLVPASVKGKCDASWPQQERRDLCYRTALASKSLADLLGALNGQTTSFEARDQSVVDTTFETHPRAQCRLDTYLEGSTCNVPADSNHIPGKNHPRGQASVEAAMEAAAYTCSKGSQVMYDQLFSDSYRPSCWYKEIWDVR